MSEAKKMTLNKFANYWDALVLHAKQNTDRISALELAFSKILKNQEMLGSVKNVKDKLEL